MKLHDVIDEGVKKQYLYHNTGLIWLPSVLKFGALGKTKDWSPTKGTLSIKKGWISFSRNPRYKAAPGTGKKADVKFVFDRDKLKHRYKIEPVADRTVATDMQGRNLVKGKEARWESEEIVLGPVKLKDGLVRIELYPHAKKDLLQTIESFKHNIKHAEERLEMFEKGYFWHQIDKKWKKFENDKQRKVHSKERINKARDTYKKSLKKYLNILNYPKLGTVSS